MPGTQRFYRNSPKYVSNLLIDVNYNDIIAKSKRIKSLLKPETSSTNDVIVGARFSNAPEEEENHIITYYVDEPTVKRTINELQIARSFLNDCRRKSGYSCVESIIRNRG